MAVCYMQQSPLMGRVLGSIPRRLDDASRRRDREPIVAVGVDNQCRSHDHDRG